jgi:small subunit ribosomal protein S1
MSYSDPWKEFANNHQRGERLIGIISNVVIDIGLFVSLEDGIDGIVHLNDLDWTIANEDSLSRYFVGDQVEVVILSIRPDLKRITLGIKQLGPDPRPNEGDDPPAPLPVSPRNPRSPDSQTAAVNRE